MFVWSFCFWDAFCFLVMKLHMYAVFLKGREYHRMCLSLKSKCWLCPVQSKWCSKNRVRTELTAQSSPRHLKYGLSTQNSDLWAAPALGLVPGTPLSFLSDPLFSTLTFQILQVLGFCASLLVSWFSDLQVLVFSSSHFWLFGPEPRTW